MFPGNGSGARSGSKSRGNVSVPISERARKSQPARRSIARFAAGRKLSSRAEDPLLQRLAARQIRNTGRWADIAAA